MMDTGSVRNMYSFIPKIKFEKLVHLVGFIIRVLKYVGAVLQNGRSLVRFQMVSLEIFIVIKYFRSHYGSRVDSASNRNEYLENFLGVKAVGA